MKIELNITLQDDTQNCNQHHPCKNNTCQKLQVDLSDSLRVEACGTKIQDQRLIALHHLLRDLNRSNVLLQRQVANARKKRCKNRDIEVAERLVGDLTDLSKILGDYLREEQKRGNRK